MKAILVIDMPKDCSGCSLCDDETGNGYYCMAHSFQEVGWVYSKPDWCELHGAIGYIKPNGEIRYFVEGER